MSAVCLLYLLAVEEYITKDVHELPWPSQMDHAQRQEVSSLDFRSSPCLVWIFSCVLHTRHRGKQIAIAMGHAHPLMQLGP